MRRIYICEDDESIRELVLYALKSGGFQGCGFEAGEALFQALEAQDPPELLLLDIMLPGEDGLSILSRLRRSARFQNLPVILLTAKGSEYDKVKGLDAGADDYIAKPFGVMELMSRINAVLRRASPAAQTGSTLTYKDLTQDDERHEVTAGGERVTLTFKEFELLRYLLLNQRIVLSRDRIMEAVWGYDFEGESRTVDMHIKTLRQKLGAAGAYIVTVRNVGYKIGE